MTGIDRESVLPAAAAATDPRDASSNEYMATTPVVLALVVGAVLFVLALVTSRTRSTTVHARAHANAPASGDETPSQTHTANDAASELSVSSRSRAYVEHKIAAHDVVLFVDASSSNAAWPHFETLLLAVLAPLRRECESCVAFVNLATTAQGRSILAALQDMVVASSDAESEPNPNALIASTAETTVLGERSRTGLLTEFLFVRGVFVGDYRRVKQLLIAGELPATLARGASTDDPACAFDAIRIDSDSAAGFIVLGPRQCFQTVRCDDSDDGGSRLSTTRSTTAAGDAIDDDAVDPLVETRPLDSVDELLRHAVDQHVVASAALLPHVPLAQRARSPARRSRLLVCHDMKGGYLSDRFTQGSAAFDAYRFYQWDLVDVFVYFGHHLVCIPPAGWIAAGHRNGTHVLGAVVIDGERGEALAAQLFQDRAAAEQGATALAAIAALYGFDGYLVNVESDIDAACVANVLVFLETLRAALHAANASAQVVWYASLAHTGKRAHQRRLDSSVVPFFRCVDALFTDYGWSSEDAKVSAALDLDRRYDVFMGIDVFGRHDTLGGGQLRCDVALRAAWNAGVSAALFAPGWTHECLQHEAPEDFVTVEERFWTAVRTGWKPRSPSFSALGGRDSLYSAFNVGRGQRVWVDGARQSGATEWSNVLEMDRQPVAALHAGVTVQTRLSMLRAVVTHATAFQGGACVAIEGRMGDKDKAYIKLFDVDIALSARHVAEVSYTTAQPLDGSVALLVLTVCPGLDRTAHQLVLRSDASSSNNSQDAATAVALSSVVGTAAGKHFYAPVWTREYSAADDADSTRQCTWVKKTYRLGGMLWDQKHIVEVGVLCTRKSARAAGDATRAFHACVGEVCIAGRTSLRGGMSVGSIAAAPRACVDASVTRFARLDSDSVRFRVQWSLAEPSGHRDSSSGGGSPVHYVLVYLCDRSSSSNSSVGDAGDSMQLRVNRRVLLGKSFGASFTVERCPWRHAPCSAEQQHQRLLQLELVSVSWTGTAASDADVCRVYLRDGTRGAP